MMSRLTTTDNNQGKLPIGDEADLRNLKRFAGRTIGKLTGDEFPHLLVFPRDLAGGDDRIGQDCIYTLGGKAQAVRLITGNIVGFVGVNDTQLTIRSRFGNPEQEDFFLHYMLGKVFSVNLFDLKHTTSRQSSFDFLLYLFPRLLQQALRLGLYKEYRTKQHNDAGVKGVIDLRRHIQKNIPFAGRVAYNAKELSYDNRITQLLRHTIELLRRHQVGNRLLRVSSEMEHAVEMVVTATPTYHAREVQRVVSDNVLHPFRHPCFVSYQPLQRLCIQILQHEKLKYGQEHDKIYGILFDAAWLWEEYLNTLLHPLGFRHPKNRTGRGGITLFENPTVTDDEIVESRSRYRRYPDFLRPGYVFDAKYKHLESGRIARDDMHQIISYMYVEQAFRGGFVYPHPQATFSVRLGRLRGYGGVVDNIGLHIPPVGRYVDFVRAMEVEEKRLTALFD
ncbi:McrC family protein [Prevotella dentasini]|uniref:McrC family protein n=1 Tax=Prevotella dentasini TaxID=589537 RepID=UPI000AFC1B3E|nr:hypothetical protein [Prevotella dentasini]